MVLQYDKKHMQTIMHCLNADPELTINLWLR